MLPSENTPFLLEILDEQDFLEADLGTIRPLCEEMVRDHRIKTGRIGVVLVDGATIQQYNRDFLKHDYQTDVISFPMEHIPAEGLLEGEILVCTQVALERAEEFGWTPAEELLLYIIHGILHLLGWDDVTPELRRKMQQKEREYLRRAGIKVPQCGNSMR